jgi:hypothetical protein
VSDAIEKAIKKNALSPGNVKIGFTQAIGRVGDNNDGEYTP